MFQKLQELPLLMGLSVTELMRIVELVDFDFKKFSEGTTFVNQGDRCDRIIYVLSGEICVDRRDDNMNMLYTEYIKDTPYLIEPHNQWGLKQRFTHTYTFTTDGSTIIIDKRQLSMLISEFDIIKTNILSMVCNNLQYANALLLEPFPSTTAEKLKRFVYVNSLVKHGRKIIRIKMSELADIIDETRLNVSKTLNIWKEQGLVDIRRGCIEIYDAKKLLEL